MATGLFKKLVLSVWLAYVLKNYIPMQSGLLSWSTPLTALIFGLQLYFDFSGYSDIAIGTSRWLGITVAENFRHPYLQTNMSAFWRSWHISLSDWIRDYLFFPLSQVSSSKTWLLVGVPIIAMAICGIWHGAA